MSDGPFRPPKFPDIPQSWFTFIAQLIILGGIGVTMTTSIISCIQTTKNGQGLEQHSQQLGEIKEQVEQTNDKADAAATAAKAVKTKLESKEP